MGAPRRRCNPARSDPDTEPDLAGEPESEAAPEAASADPAEAAEQAPTDDPAGAGAGGDPPPRRRRGPDWSATPGSIDEGTRNRPSGAAPWPGDSRPPRRDEGGFGAQPFDPGSVLPNLARMFDPRIRRRPAGRFALAHRRHPGTAVARLAARRADRLRPICTCEPRVVWVAWLIGLVLVGALVLVPCIAAVLAAGAAGALVVAVPAFILTATGGARVPDESAWSSASH